MSRIAVIAAVARNNVIGDGSAMPWHLPEDARRFRALTQGHAVIMGRKTWDSLPARFRPLPGRRNIVVTRDSAWQASGAERASSPEAAIGTVGPDDVAYVIGGSELYAAVLPLADVLELTEIDRDFTGTTRFPAFDRTQFVEVARVCHRAEPPNDFEFAFVTYHRAR
jgi:dihydrofolate reductase